MPSQRDDYVKYFSEDQQLQQHVQNLLNTETLRIICSIFKNIINHPQEKKFRKIKLSNPKLSKVLAEKGALEILTAGGFKKTQDTLEFDDTVNDLSQLKTTLEKIQQFSTNKPQLLNELIVKWQSLLGQGDTYLKNKDYPQGLLLYQQSADILEPYFLTHQSRVGVLIAHSYEQIGKAYKNLLLKADKSIFYFEKAIQYCPKKAFLSPAEGIITAQCYLGLAEALVLQSVRDWDRIFDALERAWVAVQFSRDDFLKFSIARMLSVTFTYCGDKQSAAEWAETASRLDGGRFTGSNPLTKLQKRFMDVEREFSDENAAECIDKLKQIVDDGLSVSPEFSACVCGQIIYHHRKAKTLRLEDGIEWGMKALQLLKPTYGEKHDVVLNVYISLADTYKRLGDAELAKHYEQKIQDVQKLLKH